MVDDITERKICEMFSGAHLVLRASIVLGMVAAVVTIIYFTPYPGKFLASFHKNFNTSDGRIVSIFVSNVLLVKIVKFTIWDGLNLPRKFSFSTHNIPISARF